MQTHFNSTQGAGKHQLIEITDMANSEYLAFHFAETCTQRHIESVQNQGTQGIGIVTFRHSARNQDGVLVGTCKRSGLMRRRPA